MTQIEFTERTKVTVSAEEYAANATMNEKEEMAQKYVSLLSIKGDDSLIFITQIKNDYGLEVASEITARAIAIILNSNI